MAKKKTKKKQENNGRFMKFVVLLVVLQGIIYTWVHLYLSHDVGMEIAPTVSVAFLAFCLGELGACTLIKNKDPKNTYEEGEDEFYGQN